MSDYVRMSDRGRWHRVRRFSEGAAFTICNRSIPKASIAEQVDVLPAKHNCERCEPPK